MDQLEKTLFKLPTNNKTPFLKKRGFGVERDIQMICSTVFNIENCLKKGIKLPKNIVIPISNELYKTADLGKLKQDIEELVSFVLLEKTDIIFKRTNTEKYKKKTEIAFEETENLCLFSGGVDSLTGILASKAQYGEDLRGVFVAHNDQPWVISIVNRLAGILNKTEKLAIDTVYAPPMGSTGYSQMRGFLYCVSAGIYAKTRNSKRIIISECGPTMYQVRFSPFDTITMTTHPFVLQKAKMITENILHRKIEYVTPFENLTKAEVIRLNTRPDLIEQTHSCISTRFGKNDGTCYGCVVRRLGSLAAGVKDDAYTNNPLVNSEVNSDHLLNLLRFSSDILDDYDRLPYFGKDSIEAYSKQDLFQRFALDNFIGVNTVQVGRLNPHLFNIITQTIIDPSAIQKRTELLREGRINADFTKIVR